MRSIAKEIITPCHPSSGPVLSAAIESSRCLVEEVFHLYGERKCPPPIHQSQSARYTTIVFLRDWHWSTSIHAAVYLCVPSAGGGGSEDDRLGRPERRHGRRAAAGGSDHASGRARQLASLPLFVPGRGGAAAAVPRDAVHGQRVRPHPIAHRPSHPLLIFLIFLLIAPLLSPLFATPAPATA